MTRVSELHKKWMKKPKYRRAYEALEDTLSSLPPARRKRVKARTAKVIAEETRKRNGRR